MYNLLLASNFPVVMRGISAVAKQAVKEDLRIENATSFEHLEDMLATYQYQMLVLDLQFLTSKNTDSPDSKEFRKLIGQYPMVKKIILYEAIEKNIFKWLYERGINGIVGKSASLLDIETCIEKVYGGKLYIENKMLLDFIGNPEEKKIENKKRYKAAASLTKREKIIAKLLIEGKSNIQICTLLQLRPSTVSTFKNHVFKKLSVTNVLELEKWKQIAV